MKNKYLDFYRINFSVGKYCAKSWGLVSYEAGAASRQAEIDELQKRINLALSAVWNDELSHIVIDILRGESDE